MMLKATSSPTLPLSISNGNGSSSHGGSSPNSANSLLVSTGAATNGATRTLRSESMAYPKTSRTNTLWTKLQFYARHNMKAIIASVAFLSLLLVMTSDAIHDVAGPGAATSNHRSFLRFRSNTNAAVNVHWGGAAHAGTFDVQDSVDAALSTSDKVVYHFAAVSDLDQLSSVKEKSKPTFRSILLPGLLTRNTADGRYDITIQDDQKRILTTEHNEAGRGGEFSELTIYNNRLLTFDDRTGDVFEIIQTAKDAPMVVPRFIITEGEGDTGKGMKWEWATVKDGELYMGSMGKEYTRSDGTIANTNNMWIGVLDAAGTLRREDWQAQYNFVRRALNAAAPGYLIMEAILWSDHWQKWIFLPRRISSEKYDDVQDEHNGGRKLVFVDANFTTAEVVEIQIEEDGLRGFSSFAFVPGTKDQHALAIRSVEENCTGDLDVCQQRSYFVVFDVKTGQALSNEIKLSENMKFEGIEFVNIYK